MRISTSHQLGVEELGRALRLLSRHGRPLIALLILIGIGGVAGLAMGQYGYGATMIIASLIGAYQVLFAYG